MENDRVSLSTSLAVKWIVLTLSSNKLICWSFAIGLSFCGVMVIFMVASLLSLLPSFTLKLKLSNPV